MARTDLLTPEEARADPAHRLWFAFTDAAAKARETGRIEDHAAARRAADAFYADFTANSTGRANEPSRTADAPCVSRSIAARTAEAPARLHPG